MLHGSLVVVETDKNKERKVEDAIESGVRLYQKHYPDYTLLDFVAYINPKLRAEIDGRTFSIDVLDDKRVPYPLLWVCRKEEGDDLDNK